MYNINIELNKNELDLLSKIINNASIIGCEAGMLISIVNKINESINKKEPDLQ